jgi:hypothetical protein
MIEFCHFCKPSSNIVKKAMPGMRTLTLSGPIIILCLLCSCQPPGERDIRDYYFPVKALQSGMVYEYRVVGPDTLPPDYWYYLSHPTDSAYYLTKTYYRSDYTQQQLIREEMVRTGMLTEAVYLFTSDSSGRQHSHSAEVLQANTFPFRVKDDRTVYLYKIRFQLPDQPHGQTTLILNRRFRGDTVFYYEGENYPAVRFALAGLVEQRDSIQGDIEPKFWGEEIYAKGLGLVSYRRDYDPNEPGLTYELVDRYPMRTFTQQAEPYLR